VKWLRSLAAIGAGAVVGVVLFSFGLALCVELSCWSEPGCGVGPQPAFAVETARAIAGRFTGPPETWQVVAAFIGLPASIVVAGFVAALLASSRQLAHAAVVGPLVVAVYFAEYYFVERDSHVVRLDLLVYYLCWALPAALGALPVGWVTRRRAGSAPES